MSAKTEWRNESGRQFQVEGFPTVTLIELEGEPVQIVATGGTREERDEAVSAFTIAMVKHGSRLADFTVYDEDEMNRRDPDE